MELICNLPGGDSRGGSCSTSVYSSTLSTEVIWFSSSADCRIPHWNIPVSPIVCVMARPTLPPKFSINKYYKNCQSPISQSIFNWIDIYITTPGNLYVYIICTPTLKFCLFMESFQQVDKMSLPPWLSPISLFLG